MNTRDQKNREPWLAVNLSYFFAGLGQIYAGRVLRGIVYFLSLIALTLLAIWKIFAPQGDIRYGVGFAGAAALLYLWNLIDAYITTKRGNDPGFQKDRKLTRDPWLAVFFNQVAPGLGHLYIQQTLLGLILVGIYAVLYAFQQLTVFLGFLAVMLSAGAVAHVYFQAPSRREQSRKPIIFLVIAILVYGVSTTAVPFYVESEVMRNFTTSSNHMAPAIYKGDRFFVRVLPSEKYQRGDVLVFELPGDTTWIYLRRLIGLEGDRVEIREDSTVYVNGVPAFAPEHPAARSIPGGVYAQPGDPYTVPQEAFFFLADNADNSEDSRNYGAVSVSNVIGRAYKIYWPLSRSGPVE